MYDNPDMSGQPPLTQREMINRSAASGHYIDGQLAPNQSMTTRELDVEEGNKRPPHGPQALRRVLGATIPVNELARMLWAGCQEPPEGAKAAHHRIVYDYRVYVTNQLIGAPKQAVTLDVAVIERIKLVWGQAAAEAYDAESRLLDVDAPTDEHTSDASDVERNAHDA